MFNARDIYCKNYYGFTKLLIIIMLLVLLSYYAPGPRVRKNFSSNQLGMKLLLLINAKLPAIPAH